MSYRVTTIQDITNVGGNVVVVEFDDFYAVQDYFDAMTEDMDDDEKENFMFNAKIEGIK